MKKAYLTLIIIITALPLLTNAQWISGAGGIYYNAGSVGIGTTVPSDKIEIVGGYLTSGIVSLGNTGNVGAHNYINLGSDLHGTLLMGSNIYVTSESGYTALKIAKTHGTMAGAGIIIPGNGQNYQSCIMFHTAPPGNVVADASYYNCRMIINEHGNVGIGTLLPDQKLAVNGTIHSQGVLVDMNGWSDFVFNPTYNLTSLLSVKKYLGQNHHLPDMPSEQQIIKNGVNLGEMVKLQTQKIEELTLYLIEKDEQLTNQKKEIEQLKQKQNTRITALEKKLNRLNFSIKN